MSLTLLFHPLSSYCQKVLVGLYELGTPFDGRLVDLGDAAQRAALLALWPFGKFPVLRDEARDLTVVESTIILEHLDARAGGGRLVPDDADAAREVRLRDRFFDLYVMTPMQKIVTDKLRPDDAHDAYGVAHARAQLLTAYDVAESWLARRPAGAWAVGDTFTLADCAAAPALFYALQVAPLGDAHRHLAAYFARLAERPSFARVLAEATPYLAMFPG